MLYIYNYKMTEMPRDFVFSEKKKALAIKLNPKLVNPENIPSPAYLVIGGGNSGQRKYYSDEHYYIFDRMKSSQKDTESQRFIEGDWNDPSRHLSFSLIYYQKFDALIFDFATSKFFDYSKDNIFRNFFLNILKPGGKIIFDDEMPGVILMQNKKGKPGRAEEERQKKEASLKILRTYGKVEVKSFREAFLTEPYLKLVYDERMFEIVGHTPDENIIILTKPGGEAPLPIPVYNRPDAPPLYVSRPLPERLPAKATLGPPPGLLPPLPPPPAGLAVPPLRPGLVEEEAPPPPSGLGLVQRTPPGPPQQGDLFLASPPPPANLFPRPPPPPAGLALPPLRPGLVEEEAPPPPAVLPLQQSPPPSGAPPVGALMPRVPVVLAAAPVPLLLRPAAALLPLPPPPAAALLPPPPPPAAAPPPPPPPGPGFPLLPPPPAARSVDPGQLSIRQTIERIYTAVQTRTPENVDRVPIVARPVLRTGFTIPNTITPHILYQTVMLKSTSFKRYLNMNKQSTFLVKDYDSLAEFFRENTNFTDAGTVDKVYSVNIRQAIPNPGQEIVRIIEFDVANPNYINLEDFTTGPNPALRNSVISFPIALTKTIPKPEKNFYEIYEPENTGCGRQSLNNLLGSEIFDKGVSDPINRVDDNYIYNMVHGNDRKFELMALCQKMHDVINKRHPLGTIGLPDYCSSDENYHQHVLRLALLMLGFNTFEYTPANIPMLVRLGGGDITNLQGLLLHCNGRWTVLRKYLDGRQVKFRYIDPMASETPEELVLPNGNIVSKDEVKIENLSPSKTSAATPSSVIAAPVPVAGPASGPAPKGDARLDEKERLKRVNRGLARPWTDSDVNTLVNRADRNYPGGRFDIGNYQSHMIRYMNTQANQQAIRPGLPHITTFHT